MFKQWFKNLCNPTPALKQDERMEDFNRSMKSYSYFMTPEQRLEQDINGLKDRVKLLRSTISVIAKEKKEINVFDFDSQLTALLKAQEAVSHQMMVANQNQAVTDILTASLRDEIAKMRFLVFEDVTVDPDVAEKKYALYVQEANDQVYGKK